MARPTKTGLDYYPMDTKMDDNMEILEAKHGIAGFGVMVKLYQKIYSEGYYINWDEDTKLLFCKRVGVEIEFVNKVIETAFTRNMLSESKYKEHNILTGRGIQKRFFVACKHTKRKTVQAVKDYLCVNGEYMDIITELTSVNSEETPVNTEFSTQKKREEKKRNNTSAKAEIELFFKECWSEYPRKTNKGQISDSVKAKRFKMGDEFKRCINRYKAEVKENNTEEKYIKAGSTFWNSGYLDYADENYNGKVDVPQKTRKPFVPNFVQFDRDTGELL